MGKGFGGGHLGTQHFGEVLGGRIYPDLGWTLPAFLQTLKPVQLVELNVDSVRRYATREVFVNGAVWQRGLGEIVIERRLQEVFYGFLSPTTIEVRLPNIDGALSMVFGPSATDRRGSVVNIYSWDEDVGGAATLEASGSIASIEVGDEVVLQIAVELPSVLLTTLPKETTTTQKFPSAVDLGFGIPVLFGNVKRLPLAYVYVNLVSNVYIYLVSYAGVTPTVVYRDDQVVSGGEYTIYNGTYNNSVAGVGGNLTAYCVIVFTTEQRDFSDRLYDRTEGDRMTADVTGLAPERNFARAIRSILSNTTWGLAQSVDATTFDQAESDLSAIGSLYCDGWLLEQKSVKEYLDELALTRGMRFSRTSAGAWQLYVDKVATTYVGKFGYNDIGGLRNLIEKPAARLKDIGDSVSTLEVEFRHDPISRTYAAITTARSVTAFGQPKRFRLNFVRDSTTADKISDYLTKKLKLLDHTIDTGSGHEARALKEGDRVTVEARDYGVFAPYEVFGIRKRLTSVELNLARYRPDPYTYTAAELAP